MKRYAFTFFAIAVQLALITFNLYLARKKDLPVRYFEITYSYWLGDTAHVSHTGTFKASGPPDYDFILQLIKNTAHKPINTWSINALREISLKEYQVDTTVVKATRLPVHFETI